MAHKTIKPRAATQEDHLRVALARFASPKDVADYEALLLAGSRAYRQGVAMSSPEVCAVIAEFVR